MPVRVDFGHARSAMHKHRKNTKPATLVLDDAHVAGMSWCLVLLAREIKAFLVQSLSDVDDAAGELPETIAHP